MDQSKLEAFVGNISKTIARTRRTGYTETIIATARKASETNVVILYVPHFAMKRDVERALTVDGFRPVHKIYVVTVEESAERTVGLPAQAVVLFDNAALQSVMHECVTTIEQYHKQAQNSKAFAKTLGVQLREEQDDNTKLRAQLTKVQAELAALRAQVAQES